MNKKQWDYFEYRIAEHYLSALINREHSSLDYFDEKQFTEFTQTARDNALRSGFTIGHWCDVEGTGNDWGRCEVSGLFAMRCTVRLMVYKGELK